MLSGKHDDLEQAASYLIELNSSPIRSWPEVPVDTGVNARSRPVTPPRPRTHPLPIPLTPELSMASTFSMAPSIAPASTNASVLSTPASNYLSLPPPPKILSAPLSVEPGVMLEPSFSRSHNVSTSSNVYGYGHIPGTYDGLAGGFRTPSPVQKSRSRTDWPTPATLSSTGWMPHRPVGGPQ